MKERGKKWEGKKGKEVKGEYKDEEKKLFNLARWHSLGGQIGWVVETDSCLAHAGVDEDRLGNG